jgi:hypothetical protein
VIRVARFLVLAILTFLVVSQAAQAASFRSPELEAKLPTAVPVFCTDNSSASYALIAEREIYLDAPTCQGLLHGKPSAVGNGGYSWAQNAHTLLHEWWHVQFQERNEKRTECGAYATYRYWLTTYWGLNGRTAQQFYSATAVFSPYAPLGCAL